MIGWVDGAAVDATELDDRLAVLRSGPGAAALPRPGTQEARQLRRWAAHVLFTEKVCHSMARELDLTVGEIEPLPATAAVHLGSITAAAWHSAAAVGAVCRALFLPADDREPGLPVGSPEQWYRVSHVLAPQRADLRLDALSSIGWTTLGDLPPQLAAALRDLPLGQPSAPVQSDLGWHLARIEDVREVAGRAAGAADGADGEQLRAFTLWLDRRRAHSVVVAEGFEHPGDPRQPDNTHRH